MSTDYCFSAQSQFDALNTFDILTLSPAVIPPSSFPQLDLGFSFSCSGSDVKSEIDRLPFAAALSDFVSDVIPQFIADGLELDGELGFSKNDKYDEFFRASSDIRVQKENEGMETLEFDIPEMDFTSVNRESLNLCEENEAALIFDVPPTKIPLDVVDVEMKVTITCPNEIVKSICTVELIPDCLSAKESISKPDELSEYGNKLPEFEVNEINSDLEGTLSLQNPFCTLLPCIDQGPHTHIHEMFIDAKELLGSTNLNVFEHSIANTSSEQCNIDEPISVNSVIDMSMINLNGRIVVEENYVIQPLVSDESCSLQCSIYFQEVQILDIPAFQIYEQFGNSQAVKEKELSDKTFEVVMDPVGNFYDSVVSSELALVDDTFKSLPVPIFSDCKYVNFIGRIFGDVLSISKPHALTASDNLYLDWHLLLEDPCTREICSTFTCMMYEVTNCNTYLEPRSNNQDTFSIKLDFIDDSMESLDMFECKEVFAELNDNALQTINISKKPVFAQNINSVVNNNQEENKPENVIPDKIASLGMSQSDDLSFFMGARKGSVRKSFSGETMKRTSNKDEVMPHVIFPKETLQPPELPDITLKQWDVEVQEVELSDNILSLINNIQKSYLAILNYGTDLKTCTFSESEDFKFLSLSKKKLTELISEKSRNRCSSGYMDETFMGLLALYAIKQLTYILCFYGIHTAHLYISNLTSKIDNLVIRLRPLETLLEDARQKSEMQLHQSHPSLSVIEDILKSDTSQIKKILIVADRLFLLPLNHKLTQIRVKLLEVIFGADRSVASGNNGFHEYITQALLHADCLLISHENIFDAFPFNKFSTVIEYGGSYATSRLHIVSSKYHLPRMYFIKVNMENHSLPKAICEGFDVPSFLTLDGVSRSIPSLEGILDKERIEKILSIVPIDKSKCISSESRNHSNTLQNNEPPVYMSNPSDLNNTATEISSLDVVIVINTQNLEKKMLISRRSSYQKILALEKDGAQVVERDSSLPFDLIFSAAVCLVWYETRNFGENITATSSIPMFMETIATNVLMTLSFAFSGCILIFEGETSFISAIMQSSDTLYAAAASLDLNLQLFCSYTPESTDEIILSCIQKASKSTQEIFPAMPESETLAESFLTKFPSINPLTAHAILSSGGVLVEFLEWSQKHRIQAIGKYNVPAENIHLFDTLCRYGEIGESKSVMTDCSSNGSDISSGKMLSENKMKRQAMHSQKLYMHMEDPYHVETMNKEAKENINELHKTSQPHNLTDSFNLQDERKAKRSHLFPTNANLFSKCASHASRVIDLDNNETDNSENLKEKSGDEVIDYSRTFLHSEHEPLEKKQIPYIRSGTFDSNAVDHSYGHLKGNLSDGGFNKKYSSLPKGSAFFQEAVPRSKLSKNLSSYRTFPTSEELNSNIKEKLGDEVIDYKATLLDGECEAIKKRQRPYSRTDYLERNDYGHVNEDLTSNISSHHSFPTSEHLNYNIGSWTATQDRSLSLQERVLGKQASSSSKNSPPSKQPTDYLRMNNVPITRSLLGLQNKVKVPHSKTTRSSKPQNGMQSIFRFFQGSKDKTEVHQPTLACNTCIGCPGSSSNSEKAYKKMSPTVIDSFKYRANKRTPESFKKWRKGGRAKDGSNIKDRKETSSRITTPPWTPVDKRARQNLSFSRTGNEKQSKLVWTNRPSHDSTGISRKRCRDAV